jgi:hypothetical protein
MATSPNFNWPEPDNTDLVKNGALAIRTAVNAIDTSMAELLGGTTGQVLSKSSNTSMDFTWAAPSAASPLTTKGDLYGYSTTNARVAVGANNTVLVADSAEATGVKWAGGWTTWTPTFTNFTLGNGTVTARYQQVGKTVNFSILVSLGSTSVMGTTPYFTLPVTAAANGNFAMQMSDSGASNYLGSLDCSTTLAYLTATVTSGAYATIQYAAATQPFIWSINDNFAARGSYEAA